MAIVSGINGVVDPIVPGDGTQNITGNLNVSGSITGGSIVTAPAAHAASHQNSGTDEISVTGLSGLLADPQPHHEDVGPFGGTNFAAAQTGANLISIAALGGGASHRYYWNRRARTLQKYSAYFTGLASNTGTLTILLYVNGATDAANNLLFDPASNADAGVEVTIASPIALAVGDLVEFRVTTTADWSATACDAVVWCDTLVSEV
jgi:hypothetical protein